MKQKRKTQKIERNRDLKEFFSTFQKELGGGSLYK